MAESDLVQFHDTTLRDGGQSLWGMFVRHGAVEAVLDELDRGGMINVETNMIHPVYFKNAVFILKEDPWETCRLWKRKTKNMRGVNWAIGTSLNSAEMALWKPMAKLWVQTVKKNLPYDISAQIVNTRDETERDFPWLVPILRGEGIELYPAITYGVSPRHTDEYYSNFTKELIEKWNPDGIILKDVMGLLTPERARTWIPAITQHVGDRPVVMHSHGMSGNHEKNFVEAMKAGVRIFTTCVPPLAYGSSHPSIFNTIHNAHALGLKTNIDEEPLRIVEQRLTAIAKEEGLPIGAPEPYDLNVYRYQIPGGVISNTVAQLKQLGIEDKLHEVLEDTAQIIVDLGHPLMITPHSQFIVSQAAINVATGERYGELLDYMIEFALGIWGNEESGVPYMDQNLKDKLLSHPNAKLLSERWEQRQELAETMTIKKMRADYGMTDASDEDFLLAWVMGGTEQIKAMREAGPPKRYYTGQEPLVVLLNELKKHKDISRLQLRKGDSFFDFRQKQGDAS